MTASENAPGNQSVAGTQPVEEGQEELAVRTELPENLRAAVFANHVAVSCTPGEFVITFAQIPPLRDEADIEEVRRTQQLTAIAVANIAVTHALLPKFIRALEWNLERLKELKRSANEAAGTREED